MGKESAQLGKSLYLEPQRVKYELETIASSTPVPN